MAEIFYGKPVAEKIRLEMTQQAAAYREKGIIPCVTIVRVGENPDDKAYENRVFRNCEQIGIEGRSLELPLTVRQEEFLEVVEKLNGDGSVHGVLILRPLPAYLDADAIGRALAREKDIDCMNPANLEKIFVGQKDAIPPCTPEAVIEILKYYAGDLTGKHAVIVNRSLVLGKPLAMLLLQENATVTICHSKTKNLPQLASSADIFIAAAGRAKLFGEEYVSEKSFVVDVGINFIDGKMCGDMDFDAAAEKAAGITPVPGGVGPVTSMLLLRHVLFGMQLNGK